MGVFHEMSKLLSIDKSNNLYHIFNRSYFGDLYKIFNF